MRLPGKAPNLREWLETNRDELWAQAVALYGKGERPNLPPELWEAQRAVNRTCIAPDPISDALCALADKGEGLTRDEIFEAVLGRKWKQRLIKTPSLRGRIMDGLRGQGWTRKRTSARRYWEPPLSVEDDSGPF